MLIQCRPTISLHDFKINAAYNFVMIVCSGFPLPNTLLKRF